MCSSPSYYLKLWYLPPSPLPPPATMELTQILPFLRGRGRDGGKPENSGFLGIKGSGLGLRESTTCKHLQVRWLEKYLRKILGQSEDIRFYQLCNEVLTYYNQKLNK
jgi:hypothetical protein